MYLPGLPKLASDLGTSVSVAQLSLTACMLGLALGQLLAGPISDVKGRRGPLLIGLAVFAIASLLCVFASSIWIFLGLRFIQGLAGAAGIVVSRAIVRDMFSGAEMTKFYSLLMLVNGAAPILAPIIGGQILMTASWRAVFMILVLFGIGILIAAFFGLGESLPPERRSRAGIKPLLQTFGRLLRDRLFMGYALTQGFILGAMFAYISGSPFVLQQLFGVSPQAFSYIFAMNGLGVITASQITGRLAGRLGEKRLLQIGLGIAFSGAVGLLIMIVADAGLYFVLAPLFLVVSSIGIVTTTGFSLALQHHGHQAGSASALLGLLSYIVGGMLMPLVGLGGSQTALPLGIVIVAAETAAVLCYLLLVRRNTA